MEDYLATLKKSKGLHVVVGVTSDVDYTYPTGQTIQEVAATHEFGIGVPTRSFIRTPVLENDKKIKKFIKTQFKKVLDNGVKAEDALGLVGVFVENICRGAWNNNDWPDITEETKKQKGSSAILIDTGVLKGSIASAVKK